MQGDGAKAALWQPGERLRRCRYHRCAAILLGYMLGRVRGVHDVWLWEYTPVRAGVSFCSTPSTRFASCAVRGGPVSV